MLDLARILARVTAVTEGRAPTVTPKTPPIQACTAVTAVTGEISKDAPRAGSDDQCRDSEPGMLSRKKSFDRNNRNNRTASSGAGFSVTALETESVTAVTEQARHRAWHVTLTDGARLTAVRPEGATRAQMFEHVRDTFGDRVRELEPWK